MCTVTVLPAASLSGAPDGRLLLRVVCNRDETLTRAAALPPALWSAGPRRAIMPIDPHSGGTWIAANDAGLVFALLNLNDGSPAPADAVSRGTIIPTLAGCDSVAQALSLARHIQADCYAPFRLLIVDPREIADCRPVGTCIRVRRRRLHHPVLRTSSSLGDRLVAGPRRALFRTTVAAAGNALEAQDRYHRHQWPGREAISVNMRRSGAATVSCTTVEVRERSVRVSYRAIEWPRVLGVEIAA